MQMFDSVVIACDQINLDIATAIRGVLEGFRLHVYLHVCVQERNVLDVLAGKIPHSSYVILCATGGGFQVVTQREGVWGPACVVLTPDFVRQKVALAERGIISMGCGTGRQELAQAFLHTGCRAFLGPDDLGPEDVHIDQDANALFVITFFYHLLSGVRSPAHHRVEAEAEAEAEAVRRAAAADSDLREGTHLYRYYTTNNES
jgi:hypothetical protein